MKSIKLSKNLYKILVIDDSKLNRAIVKKTLNQENITITEAVDGLDGLKKTKQEEFDLILLDIVMPNLDGFGFINEFKRNNNKFIPIILMTGLGDLNSKIKGLNIGADDFILKPLNEKELIARVHSLLRLKQAHNDLEKTFQNLKKLKEQQDGDYFLTSLLIEPLIYNKTENSTLNVETFLEQKKQFKFKKWHKHLGGDLCISQQIELRNKKYLLTVNADAMGKSIQGAGGALVLGTALHAFITNEDNKIKDPELWIKSAITTFQNVFESFNGSMMISLFMGLIDEETGIMYYVNSEHPFAILYNQEKASFLNKNIQLHKIGWPGMNEKFKIEIYKLQENDIIIYGSDGRDDLVIKKLENKKRIINEDETKILTIVENNQADLNKMVDEIKSNYELSDDLSLLKITNANNFKLMTKEKMKKLLKNNGLKKLSDYPTFIQNLLDKNNYNEALNFCLELYNIKPELNKNLLYISFIHKKLGNYKQATCFSKMLYLRDPAHQGNLINLVDILILSKNKEEAKKYLEEISKEEKHAKSIKKFENLLA